MMPGLAHRNGQYSFEFWSKNRDDISYNQLQKFWSELSPKSRQELLRIDKQTLFEQARKNMYCSRCNGLLLECFLQIVMYGKSLQREGSIGSIPCNGSAALENHGDSDLVSRNGCSVELQDPGVHPWGGLTTRRDGSLTLLSSYLYAKSLKGLQNVFDGARGRERERELLYPDACGVGGRGWISQGMVSYGRGHGTRETCALHTARLSCDTLVDFWSALGEETRQSLLRMKEEDFIERLMYRFDSKRFCRDCRRNVIREFKELKELKRMRREPCCTTWFCVADTAFQYEVCLDTIQADWRQKFPETVGIYHHFEWALGTEEGKSDILEFENVGMSRSVQVSGLDLRRFSACYITLRAFKLDGRCTEISVKAHALRGQQCVHCRLVVGDGYVSIKRGDDVRRLFEHAEEAEEEEDEDLMNKDGNELDGECARPQKHAKSPELAREFLLDAATVIFKEHVEKAFREGTARQNAHSIFVCLALTLLEERVHVAFREIITLEKQMKLLEEEEKEKRDKEERKERKRTKEREKKLRRKERLKEKDRDKEKKNPEPKNNPVLPDVSEEQSSPNIYEERNSGVSCKDSVNETADVCLSPPDSPNNQDEHFSKCYPTPRAEKHCYDKPDSKVISLEDEKCGFLSQQSIPVHQSDNYWREFQPDRPMNWSNRRRFGENASFVGRSETRYRNDRFEITSRCFNGSNRQFRAKAPKSSSPNGMECNEKFYCCSNRNGERNDIPSCSCKQPNEYHQAKVEPYASAIKSIREPTHSLCKQVAASDMSKPLCRGNRYDQTECTLEVRPKSKPALCQSPTIRDSFNSKKVWAPMESKKYPRSNSDSNVTLRSSAFNAEGIEHVSNAVESSDNMSPYEATGGIDHKDNSKKSSDSIDAADENLKNEIRDEAKNHWHSTDAGLRSSSNSDNCSSCLSEGASLSSGNTDSSSTSDSEDASQQSERKGTSVCAQNRFSGLHEKKIENGETKLSGNSFMTPGHNNPNDLVVGINTDAQHQGIFPPMLNQSIQFPMFQAPSTIGYYHQSPISWPAAPATGLTPFPHPNQYLYTGPLGYGMNGDSHLGMQYGRQLNHSANPFVNSGPIPVFHQSAKANGANAEERVRILGRQSTRRPSNESEVGKAKAPLIDETVKPDTGNDNNFSLFHFGGPVALSSQFSADDVASDHACNKKDEESEIEEYNLFAARNGLRFSFY